MTTTTTNQAQNRGVLRTLHYFMLAWLYVPYLFFVVPLLKDINENFLSLLLVAPQFVALLIAYIPIHQKRIAKRQFCWLLGPPYAAVTAWILFVID
jgi:hypothetical protein